MFTICNSLKHMATLSVDSLQTPPEGDVERAMRHELGLSCAEETIKHQLGRALRMNLSGKQVFFHLNGEACASQRDISELITTTLAQNNIVKVHVPSITGVGTLAVGSGGDESGDGETDEG
jgi:hypothetical protein